MGDPKKQKKKYRKPLMIWDEDLIEEQKNLIKEFGLKNKREIWKVESELKSLHDQAKSLIAQKTEQAEKETAQLIQRLSNLDLISQTAKLEDVLSLTLTNLLNRRLQTLVHQKGLARTIKQARQFITHNHISIGDQVLNIPSYKVKSSEEPLIKFNLSSSLSQDTHPERILDKETQEKEKKTKEEILEKKEKVEKTKSKKEKKEKTPEGLTPEKEKKEQETELKQAIPEDRKTHKEK